MSNYKWFGIECGNGWAHLYEPLIDRCIAEGVEILQIKEKFGGLRFYVSLCSKELQDMIDAAELKSFSTCEVCGEKGEVRYRKWIRTLCDEHAEESLLL